MRKSALESACGLNQRDCRVEVKVYLLIPERGGGRANTTTRASLKLIGPTGITPVPGRLGISRAHMRSDSIIKRSKVNVLQIPNQEYTTAVDSTNKQVSPGALPCGTFRYFPR